MKKTFILDTNVLLHDVQSLYAFADNHVVIPMVVIEELDTFKSEADSRGKCARMVSRELDSLRSKGRLNEGVPLPNGGTLKIELDKQFIVLKLFYTSYNLTQNDWIILWCNNDVIHGVIFWVKYKVGCCCS